MSSHLFSPEEETQVREFIGSLVRSGFTARENLLEDATDYFTDDFDEEDLKPLAARLIEEEWAAHAREEATWDELTDVDRLELAFDRLEKSGIIARHNFTCCGNCGHTEIWDETQGGAFDGYVFYHYQDTEHAVEGAGLYLAFGSFVQTDIEEEWAKNSVEIAHRAVAALREAGLKPDWDGKSTQRIHVPLVWRKRRSPI